MLTPTTITQKSWVLRLCLFMLIFYSIAQVTLAKIPIENYSKKSSIIHQSAARVQSDTTLANKYFDMASKLRKAAKYDSSIFYYEKARVLYEKIAIETDDAKMWIKFAKCYNGIGFNLRRKGQSNNAMTYFKKASEIVKDKFGEKDPKVAQGYTNIGIVHFDKGEYDQALEYFKKSLAIKLESQSKDSIDIANSYNNIGVLYSYKGEFEKALEYSNKSLAIKLKILGENHDVVAASYLNLGSLYNETGEYDKALEFHNKALAITMQLSGENHPDVAKIYNNIGVAHDKKGEFDEALEFYQKSLAIRVQVFGENHPSVAGSYFNIGSVYRDKGEFGRALEYLNKALAIRLHLWDEKHPEVANLYNTIGAVYADKGEPDKALEFYQKSLAIRVQVFGENHFEVGRSINNIGIIYKKKGDYDKALEYYNKALAIARQTLGENHPSVARSYGNIGSVYHDLGEYDKALEFYQKFLSIMLKTFGEDHPDVTLVFNNIGNVYFDKGDYDKALENHQKALVLYKRTFGEQHPDVVRSYGNIGSIYGEKGEYDKALEYHNKALAIGLKLLGENHPSVATNYDNIGSIYGEKGEFRRAFEYLNKALAIRLHLWGAKHPDVAGTYQVLGQVYEKQNNFDKALLYHQNSILSLVSDFQDSSIYSNPTLKNISSERLLLRSLESKAEAFEKLYSLKSNDINDIKMSLTVYQLASDLIDQIRSGYKAESSKLFLGKEASKIYDKAIGTALTLFVLTQDAKYKEQAFIFAEKSKSSVLLESLAELKAKSFAGIPDSLLEMETRLKVDLAFYDRSIVEELQAGQDADSAKIDLWQNKLFTLKRKYETLIQQLESDYPQYYNLKYQVNTASVADVQNKLMDESTALVEYFTGDSAIFIFTITENDFDVEVVRKDSLFEKQVQQMRNALFRSARHPNSSTAHDLYSNSAYSLYKQLIEPVETRIANRNLIIIPDGLLGYVPFGALLTKPAVGVKRDYLNLSYLIKEYAIRYSYSATLLVETKHKVKRKTVSDFIAFAPVFAKESGVRFTKEADMPPILIAQRYLNPERSIIKDNRIFPIESTEDEVVNIYDLFDNKSLRAKVFTYQHASEEKIKSLDLFNYKYIHIATHAFVNEVNPELSGIILAQDSTSSEDGILYSGEVYNLDLNADLAVLSACETGLGKVVKGEGIIGLTRGFFYAGAKSLLVSLWKVADESTSSMMIEFYEQLLNNVPKSESLKRTKLNMLNNEKFACPFFWAPFVLIGD